MLSHLHDIDDALLARARKIRLVGFDVDGTLTDGRLYFDENGVQAKHFHVRDGLGISLLRKHGVQVVFITARAGGVTSQRGKDLGVEVHITKDKLAKLREICAAQRLSLDEVAFMGDDLADLPPFKHVGLAVAPNDAHAWTAQHAHWKTAANGGAGAARELADLILVAQGHAQSMLAGEA